MNKEVEKEFSEMVANLLQIEFCEDWDPRLLHGFMGLASEAGELLNRYKKFLFYHGESYSRTEMLIELSDLLHYMQMILNTLNSDFEEIMRINIAKLKGARYKDGYSHDAAITHHRDKKAERAAVDLVVDRFTQMRMKK